MRSAIMQPKTCSIVFLAPRSSLTLIAELELECRGVNLSRDEPDEPRQLLMLLSSAPICRSVQGPFSVGLGGMEAS